MIYDTFYIVACDLWVGRKMRPDSPALRQEFDRNVSELRSAADFVSMQLGMNAFSHPSYKYEIDAVIRNIEQNINKCITLE